MNILHIAPITFNKSSGLSTVIPKIINEQNKLDNINSALVNVVQLTDEILEKKKEAFNFIYFNSNYCHPFKLSRLIAPFNKPDIVVFHSIYQREYWKIAKCLKNKQIPYIIIPHGALTEEAQNKGKVKKIIANNLFLNKIVKNATRIQYLSKGEANNSRKWKKNYIVIGNGIEDVQKQSNNCFRTSHQINITFVGRLDIRHKGLDYLLESSLNARDVLQKNNAVINIYGPDKEGSSKLIDNYIKENKLESIVNLKGPIYGKDKDNVYLDSHIFILLSRHEGLPTTVLEALSYGVPCILTEGTNFADDVEKYKCGWKVDSRPKSIAQKLKFILENFTEIDTYRENGRKLIKNYYSWEKISLNAIQEYKRII